MTAQVEIRFLRWSCIPFGAFGSALFFALLGLMLLVPKSSIEAADADIKAIDGQRQFDVILFKLKNIEEKIPGLKGVRARVRSDLSAFETSTDPSVERMRKGVAELRARKLPPEELLAEVNRIVNERVTYVSDWDGFGESDYWASPFEVIERRQGDCEDFAILKIVALHLTGWAKEDLGILAGNLETAQGVEGHAVALTRWFADGAYHYRILDNLTNTLYGPREHPAFTPLYVISPKGAGKLVSKNPGQKTAPAAGSLLGKIKSHEE